VTQRPAARRASGHARRTRPVRRASAGLSPVRAGAALVMLLTAAAMYGLTASAAFGFARLELSGVSYTDEAAVRARLAVTPGSNLFGFRTEDLESSLLELSTVVGAEVEVRLPDTLVVTIAERRPILVWKAGDRRFLVDRSGTLFAEVGENPGRDVAALRVMDDRRTDSAGLGVAERLDPVDLDAATRLGALRPADVGSVARGFRVILNDEHGFVLVADPRHWTAVFGFYTPTLRTPDIIPGQVDLLAGILARAPESNVEQVILASGDDATYTTPAPSRSSTP
jgi:hypothetical protein